MKGRRGEGKGRRKHYGKGYREEGSMEGGAGDGKVEKRRRGGCGRGEVDKRNDGERLTEMMEKKTGRNGKTEEEKGEALETIGREGGGSREDRRGGRERKE